MSAPTVIVTLRDYAGNGLSHAESAIMQIKGRTYVGALKNYDEILLVGISYNKGYKRHKCLIEKWEG